jgi:thiamine pyrophosphokinase
METWEPRSPSFRWAERPGDPHKGLRWDLDGAILEHGTTRASNVFKAPIADIRVAYGCLLAVIPVG